MIRKRYLTDLWNRQSVRFITMGGFCAAVTWGARFALSSVFPFETAVLLSCLIGMSIGFGLYRTYVFPEAERVMLHQAGLFIAVNIGSALVVFTLSLAFLRVQMGTPWPVMAKEGLAHGLAIAVGAVINFIAHKSLTFKGPS
jgi:energy-coupling factor transport system substrate-specific component